MYRLIAFLGVLTLSSQAWTATQVNVFAAASLRGALIEIVDTFTLQSPDADIRLAFAGSSALARQIAAGAPADIFISANVEWMDSIEDQGKVVAGSRNTVARNTLVLISREPGKPISIDTQTDFQSLIGDSHIAVGLVDAVPAGMYAKAALVHLGHWHDVKPALAQADNVRAALKLVALGEAPFGIVYATDAKAEPNVSVRGIFPIDSHPEIEYPAALLVTNRPNETQALAQAFHGFLSSEAAQTIFKQHGFETNSL